MRCTRPNKATSSIYPAGFFPIIVQEAVVGGRWRMQMLYLCAQMLQHGLDFLGPNWCDATMTVPVWKAVFRPSGALSVLRGFPSNINYFPVQQHGICLWDPGRRSSFQRDGFHGNGQENPMDFHWKCPEHPLDTKKECPSFFLWKIHRKSLGSMATGRRVPQKGCGHLLPSPGPRCCRAPGAVLPRAAPDLPGCRVTESPSLNPLEAEHISDPCVPNIRVARTWRAAVGKCLAVGQNRLGSHFGW